MESDGGGVGLEVSARAVTLDGVTPLRHLPLKLYLGLRGGLGQPNLDAAPGGLDVATHVNDAGQGMRPRAGRLPAAGVQRQVLTGAFIIPAWRHGPAIVAIEVAFLRLRDGSLVPGMVLVDRVAEWV